jgi:uncharacterized phage protein gp47/JayE
MTTFGVTATGFNKPTAADLLKLIQADQLAGVSASLDVAPDSLMGQLNGIYVSYLEQAWQALADLYDGFDPDKAAGVLLTNLSKLTGITRRGASSSLSTLTCTLASGTKLTAGTNFASVLGQPDITWTPLADFTAPSDGSFPVVFASEAAGPVLAAINAITVIATPVVGWSAITTSSAVTLGRVVDTDPTLRARRPLEAALGGGSTTTSITARAEAISDAVTVLNNTSDSLDANGLPAHSFEAIVSSSATDDEIAQVLWDSGVAGIPSRGTSTGNAIDVTGKTQIVPFTRPTPVLIWVSYTISPRPGYDHAAFLAGVFVALSEGIVSTDASGALTTILAPYATGVNVTSYDLTLATRGLNATGISVTFGLTAAPVNVADIVIGSRQIAAFDLSRITVSP